MFKFSFFLFALSLLFSGAAGFFASAKIEEGNLPVLEENGLPASPPRPGRKLDPESEAAQRQAEREARRKRREAKPLKLESKKSAPSLLGAKTKEREAKPPKLESKAASSGADSQGASVSGFPPARLGGAPQKAGKAASSRSFSPGAKPSPAVPIGRKTKVSFDRALPEDISNENFPDVISSFNFPSTNVSDLAQAIGKLTGMNFIVADGKIKAKKIKIIAPSKITVAEAYKAFLSALAINDLTVIRSGAFWKIVDTEKAHKGNAEVYAGDYFPNTDQLITRVIKMNHISAKDFSTSIKFLLSGKQPQIKVLESSNTIIISDYGSVIEKVMKILREIDTPGSEEGIQIIPIQYAAAEELASILNNLLFSSGGSVRPKAIGGVKRRAPMPFRRSKAAGKQRGNVKISNILADSRTNSLVVSANKEGIQRVKRLVKKLDTYVDPTRTGGIYVYNVLYGTAEEVYNTLMGIKPAAPSRKTGASRGRAAGGNAPRFRPRYSRGSSTSPLFKNVTIMADHNTNSLIISAKNKYDFERIKAMLKKIDTPRDQVFVQAVIVEMSVSSGDHWETNLARTLTNNLSGLSKIFDIKETGTPIAGFLNQSFSPNLQAIQQSKLGPGLILSLPLSGLLRGQSSKGANYGIRDGLITDLRNADTEQKRGDARRAMDFYNRNSGNLNSQLESMLDFVHLPLIQILKKAGNVNILSTPQLTALDNTTAYIEVGENAPVGVTTSNTAAGFSSSQVRQDVSMRLDITPRINPNSGTIQMDIKQKFDGFSSAQSPAAELKNRAVHILKRNIETKMVLNDGETAVMGGLLTDKQVISENKVPFLGDIPILGWLFKGSTGEKQKRNLIVFITPRIISGKDQKNQSRLLLEEKLEERINFIKKYMRGKDPQGKFLQKLQSRSAFGPAGVLKTKEDEMEDGPAAEERIDLASPPALFEESEGGAAGFSEERELEGGEAGFSEEGESEEGAAGFSEEGESEGGAAGFSEEGESEEGAAGFSEEGESEGEALDPSAPKETEDSDSSEGEEDKGAAGESFVPIGPSPSESSEGLAPDFFPAPAVSPELNAAPPVIED